MNALPPPWNIFQKNQKMNGFHLEWFLPWILFKKEYFFLGFLFEKTWIASMLHKVDTTFMNGFHVEQICSGEETPLLHNWMTTLSMCKVFRKKDELIFQSWFRWTVSMCIIIFEHEWIPEDERTWRCTEILINNNINCAHIVTLSQRKGRMSSESNMTPPIQRFLSLAKGPCVEFTPSSAATATRARIPSPFSSGSTFFLQKTPTRQPKKKRSLRLKIPIKDTKKKMTVGTVWI
jgi:hypothetical protein